MLVRQLACEPAFQLSPDVVIKQMGCDDADHNPDEPQDPARLIGAHCAALARCGLDLRGRPGAAFSIPWALVRLAFHCRRISGLMLATGQGQNQTSAFPLQR